MDEDLAIVVFTSERVRTLTVQPLFGKEGYVVAISQVVEDYSDLGDLG